MRILFIRMGSLGNALVSIPAVRAVRKEMGEAFLALLCDPATYELWQNCPFLDRVLVYDQKNKHKPIKGYLRMIAELRRLRFSHSVHFRRFLRSELIGFLSGAKVRIGFDPGGFSLLNKKVPYREDENIILQNLRLVSELGIKAEDPSLQYWAKEPSFRVKAILDKAPQPRVIIHPFAKTEREKRWHRFPELTEKLKKELGVSVIIIGQTEEKEIFQKEWSSQKDFFLTAFDLPLSELASLIKHAQLFIGADSGPLHLACALGIPALGIYRPRIDLARHLKKWQPLNKNFQAVLPPRSCAECPKYQCGKEEMIKCFGEITVEEVLKPALKLGLSQR